MNRPNTQTCLAAALALCATTAFCPSLSAEPLVSINLHVTPPATQPQADAAVAPVPDDAERPTVDIALLLDTSNSMDGLIRQAKQQLWSVVNTFDTARSGGHPPIIRVALFEYGNTRLPASEGYIRQVVGLTTDLDSVSRELFALTTSGGDEYCGEVIDEAVTRLDWTKPEAGGPKAYKAIFIAGNEPFTQGDVDFRTSVPRAIANGIVVNTIHCGPADAGKSGLWARGAELGEGKSFNIDQDCVRPVIQTPYDKVIIEINTKLNSTYLWYGAERKAYQMNQVAQDANAAGEADDVAVNRAKTKSSGAYDNTGRDLVDTYSNPAGEVDTEALAGLPEDALPDAMREMDDKARADHIKDMQAKRAELQAELKKVAAERDAYIAEQEKKDGDEVEGETLGDAMSEAVVDQLEENGFEIAEDE